MAFHMPCTLAGIVVWDVVAAGAGDLREPPTAWGGGSGKRWAARSGAGISAGPTGRLCIDDVSGRTMDPSNTTTRFRGTMEGVRLLDVVQLLCRTTATGCLQVKNGKGRGALWLRDGAIVHAEAGHCQGEEAALAILTWRYGDFFLDRRAAAPAVTIAASWEGLVMRAACALDEHPVRADEEVPPGDPEGLPVARVVRAPSAVVAAPGLALRSEGAGAGSPSTTEVQTAERLRQGETVHRLARDIGEALGLGPPIAVYGWGRAHRMALAVAPDGTARLETEGRAVPAAAPL